LIGIEVLIVQFLNVKVVFYSPLLKLFRTVTEATL